MEVSGSQSSERGGQHSVLRRGNILRLLKAAVMNPTETLHDRPQDSWGSLKMVWSWFME